MSIKLKEIPVLRKSKNYGEWTRYSFKRCEGKWKLLSILPAFNKHKSMNRLENCRYLAKRQFWRERFTALCIFRAVGKSKKMRVTRNNPKTLNGAVLNFIPFKIKENNCPLHPLVPTALILQFSLFAKKNLSVVRNLTHVHRRFFDSYFKYTLT